MFDSTLALKNAKTYGSNSAVKLAILDLGTNSIRFDVYQILEGGYTQRLARQKIMIRLGDGLYDDQKITDHSKQKLFTALSHFRRILESDPVDVIKGFATSALRDAKNSKEIIDEILKNFRSNLRLSLERRRRL